MSVALDTVKWQSVYPMDFYANDSLGPWTNNNEAHRPVRQKKSRPVKIKVEKEEIDNLDVIKRKVESVEQFQNTESQAGHCDSSISKICCKNKSRLS